MGLANDSPEISAVRKGFLAASRYAQVKFWLEAAMRGPVVCAMCEKAEQHCTCEKYCTICKGQHNVRLGADGLYYCPACREAADYKTQEEMR